MMSLFVDWNVMSLFCGREEHVIMRNSGKIDWVEGFMNQPAFVAFNDELTGLNGGPTTRHKHVRRLHDISS